MFGKVALVTRLVTRSLWRHRTMTGFLVLAITASCTTLTLGLIVGENTSASFQQTRESTAGPDVVAVSFASAPGIRYGDLLKAGHPPHGAGASRPGDSASLTALAEAPGVVAADGPYPVAVPVLSARGHRDPVVAIGRTPWSAAVDQPKLINGHWLRGHAQVVLEDAFAVALGVRTGDGVTLNGKPFQVVGTAVDAALPAFPSVGAFESRRGDNHPGLAWVIQGDAANLATPKEPLSYLMNLKLSDPRTAASFVSAHQTDAPGSVALASWQQVEQIDQNATKEVRAVLQTAALLLALLAAASVAVLVGGRLADETKRVGLLKAVGGTPQVVLAVLATEYLVLALVGAASGLAIGLAVAPALTNPGAGLLGLTSSRSLSAAGAAIVLTTALAVALVAASVPTWRAARVATLAALANAAHAPRRRGRLMAASAWLPTALLIGLRLASRRIRRSSLAACAAAITVAALVAVLAAHLRLDHVDNGVPDPRTALLNQVFVALTATLGVLAAVNIVFITWSTATDARRSLAITRALGAPPRQVAAGLLTAQILPAIPGCLIGIPVGLGLYDVARGDTQMVIPATWQLTVVAAAALVAITVIAAVPAVIGTRHSIVEALQSDI